MGGAGWIVLFGLAFVLYLAVSGKLTTTLAAIKGSTSGGSKHGG